MARLIIFILLLLDIIRASPIFLWHSSILGFDHKIKESLYDNNNSSLSHQLPKDQSISIQDRSILKDEIDELIVKLSKFASTTGSISLNLSQCRVSSLDLAKLLKSSVSNTSSISSLSFRHCNCDSETFQNIRSGKQPLSFSLKLLDLSFNNFDFASHRFLSSLLRRLRGLKTFVFNGNKLDTSSMQSIVYSIRRHPSISSLSLTSCAINDELMTDLVFGLKSNPNVTDLNLSCNLISDDGLIQLLSSLPLSPTAARIRHLDLSYCPIGDRGVTALADAFKSGKLRALESLTLRHLEGDLSPAAITQLLQSLRNHTQLHFLDLSGNCLFLDPSRPPKVGDASKGQKGGKKVSKFQKLMDGSLSQVSQLTPVAVQALQGLTECISGSVLGIFDQASQAVQGSGNGKSLSSRRLLEYDDDYNVVTPKSKSNSKLNSKSNTSLKSTSRKPSESVVKKSSKSNKVNGVMKRDTTSTVDIKPIKSKAEMKLEAKLARQSTRSIQSTLKALITAVSSCPRLCHLGLSGVGLSDAVVTQLANMTRTQQHHVESNVTNIESSNSSSGGAKGAVKLSTTTPSVNASNKVVSLVKSRSIVSSYSHETVAPLERSLQVAVGLDMMSNTSLKQLVSGFETVVVA